MIPDAPRSPYARTKTDPVTGQLLPPEEWEPLFTADCPALTGGDCPACREMDSHHGHLNKVAWWTAKFAAEMFPEGSKDAEQARQWGYLAGLWHDLGKFAPEWQEYLRGKGDPQEAEVGERLDHATAGAQHAVKAATPAAHFLAFAVSGHHSGLLDALSEHASLQKRLDKTIKDYSAAPPEVLAGTVPAPPPTIAERIPADANVAAIFNRMLFSCLVDADFLATEAFMAPEQADQRPGHRGAVLRKMAEVVEAHVAAFGEPKTAVNQARADVFLQCVEAAEWQQGLFSLTVPTGGGKTLSSLGFALRHALRYGMRRVIYVIPFTSIIEQNAAVFTEVLASLIEKEDGPVVLEHHSNLSPEKETTRSRLAAENWDAPLIVTTAVQFYESLHAARTSQCRKLHHIANSVVILDEAQCLPVDYLGPCLATLRELSRAYHTSVVLCTATQPAIHHSAHFPIGLENVREIVPEPRKLYERLQRVRIADRGTMPDTELAAELAREAQALAIVNTRKHARLLFQKLPKAAVGVNRHLSALMCPAHRHDVLEAVRERLDAGHPVRLISTQLIEAGVDIDFPVVYRSLAGIDSIAQAAGRCNRNGRLETGVTHVFRSEHVRAEAYFRDTAQIADRVLTLHRDDPLGLESVDLFFSLYYHQHSPPAGKRWDTKDIEGEFGLTRNRELPMQFQFATAARKFRLIENVQVPVLIPYDDHAKRLLDDLRNESIPLHRSLLRGLQRYTVQMYEGEFRKNALQFEPVRQGQFHILICPETHYSADFGLSFTEEPTLLIA